MFGMTREGEFVQVSESTGETNLLYSLFQGIPMAEYWSGLTYKAGVGFFSANQLGARELINIFTLVFFMDEGSLEKGSPFIC